MSVDLQSHFFDALRQPATPVPDGLTAWNSARPDRRFSVYRNNVAVGLAAALASRFPATEQIVGAEFFAGMAGAFIALHPPRSPLLLSYGDDLADFVDDFAPAAGLPYLSDVIRLEAARSRAYHAADAAPLAPATLALVAPEHLGDLKLVPHPAAAVLASTHPVVTIWSMNSGERPLAPIDHWAGEDALIVRPAMTVEVIALPPGGAAFLSALFDAATLSEALASALAAAPDFDITANLAGALRSGVFTAIQTSEPGATR
jgi:hypothetical protein